MKKRILSSLILWGSLLATIVFLKIDGGILILTLFSAAAQWELYHIWKKTGKRVAALVGTVAGSLIFPATHYFYEPLLDLMQAQYFIGVLPLLGALLLSTGLTFCCSKKIIYPGETLVPTYLGILYIPFLLHFLIIIYHLEPGTGGLYLCIWFIITAKFTDMGALLVGKSFGKHKMAPVLSPGKTWEGTIGGALTAAAASAITAIIANQYMNLGFHFPPVTAAILGIPIALVGQLGDLLESSFKRKAKLKDSGNTIPGIGGSLDLLDSLIPTAPLAYFLLITTLQIQP
jgi:phosphatidate cytidylyltransferase